ncbi:PAS domain S-box protein [Haloarchaeobius baliensis]|uniref:PAS domain S-box protein n=1 Tax=Haloarchaeobius baliensis TaxID=1670458 RepID=UPI003F885868
MNTTDYSSLDSSLDPELLTPRRITALYVLFGLTLTAATETLLPSLFGWLPPTESAGLALAIFEVFLTAAVVFILTDRMTDRFTRSELRYRNLIETSPAPINLFDEEGTIVWGNDATLDLLGLDEREELVGRSIFEFIETDDHALAQGEMRDVVEEGERKGPTSMQLRTDDGERRQIRVSTAPGRFDGEPIGQAVVLDTTLLHETEAELRSERDFVRNALDELRDLFYVVDDGGKLQRWNARVPEVTGTEADELTGTEISSFFGPDDQQRILDALESTLQDGTTFVEADLLTGDGDHRRYEFKSSPLQDPGESDRIVGIGRDVTERRRMERELRENEQRYRTLVELSPHSIMVHRDGEVVYANDALVELLGAETKTQVVGSHVNTFVPPEDYDEVADVAARTQRGKDTPTDRRRTVVTLDGAERVVETTGRQIAYEDGPAVLTIIQDVTDRHQFEEMLTTLHERTQAMTRAETRGSAAQIAAGTTADLLDIDGCCVYEFDPTNRLEPLAWAGFESAQSDEPPVEAAREGVLWEAFVEGEERTVEGEPVRGLTVDGEYAVVAVPLENHGVLALVGGTDCTTSTAQRRILDLVAESATAAFDRFEQEQDLRKRDRRLEQQNEALEQLNRLNEIIREINQTLVQATSRSEILHETCEQITDAEQYTFTWIGKDAGTEDRTVPQYWTGVDAEYIDHIGSSPAETPLRRLAEAAFRENEVRVAQDILDDPDWQSTRSEAIGYGFQSVAAVPISTGDYVDSVLVIHASDPDIFDEQEREVLAELGRTLGFALRTVDQSPGSQSGPLTEAELSLADDRLITNRITAELDASIEFVGAVPRDDDALHLFIDLTDVASGDIEERLQSLETVADVRPLSTDSGAGLYHISVSESPLVELLDRHGVRISSLTAADGVSTLVCILPTGLGVRTLYEQVRGQYPDTELVARRQGPEPVETRVLFRERLLDRLTERQRQAIQIAAYSGFYEWPRGIKSKKLAEMLSIASSTYQYHLRAAERTLVNGVLEPPGGFDL